MSKTVKQIVKESNRNPETREHSRQAQNLRRRIDTQIAKKIKEVFGEKVKSREVQKYLKTHFDILKNDEIKNLQELRKGNEYNKQFKGYELDLKKSSEVLKGYTQIYNEKRSLNKEKVSAAVIDRKNKIFERELNLAKKENKGVNLSKIKSEDVDTFYASTRFMWKSATSRDMRNTKIMEWFGINNLEHIFNLLMKKELKAEDFGYDDVEVFEEFIEELNKTKKLDKMREIIKQERKIIEGNQTTGGTTNDEKYNGPEETHKDGSPDNIQNIIVRISELFVND